MTYRTVFEYRPVRDDRRSTQHRAAGRPATLPPGPSQTVLRQSLAWGFRPRPFLDAASGEYGDMFTIRLGQVGPVVMLAHPDLIKEVFTGDPEVFHAGEANVILRPSLGRHSVLLLDDAQHMRQRKLLLPPFHGERMQRYGELMRELAEREHRDLAARRRRSGCTRTRRT